MSIIGSLAEDTCLNNLSFRLNDEIMSLINYLSLQTFEKQARELLVTYMGQVLRSRWRGASATAFGSTATGLNLPSG